MYVFTVFIQGAKYSSLSALSLAGVLSGRGKTSEGNGNASAG